MAHRVAEADAGRKDVEEHEVLPVPWDAPTSRSSAGARLLPVLRVFLVILVPCVLIVGVREHQFQPLFILDEFPYADYLHKVHDGDPFVQRGEVSGQETLRELACRGYTPDIWPVDQRPPCGDRTYDARVFPNQGVNSADIHPPSYFVLTDLGARAIMATGFTDNLIRAGRLFGSVWMAAGLTAIWFLARRLGSTGPAAYVAVAIVAGSTSLLWQWQYLTPDAANLLVGASVALIVLRWERTGSGLGFLAAAGAGAMSFKAPNVLVIATMGLYLLVRAFLARRASHDSSIGAPLQRTVRQYLTAAGALLAGGALFSAAWMALRIATKLPGRQDIEQQYAVDSLKLSFFTDNLARFLAPLDHPTIKTYQLSTIVSYLLIGSLIAAIAVASARNDRTPTPVMAGVSAFVAVFGPLLLVGIIFVGSGTYFPIELRYGTSIVPLQVAVAASLWRARPAVVVLAVFAVVYHAVGMYALFNPPA